MNAEDLANEIHQLVSSEPVVLFMKGTPTFPRCGFSGMASQILKACGVDRFAYVDMLTRPELVKPLTVYAEWPTLPALFINGEFVGGCDIAREMYEAGELQQMLQNVGSAA